MTIRHFTEVLTTSNLRVNSRRYRTIRIQRVSFSKVLLNKTKHVCGHTIVILQTLGIGRSASTVVNSRKNKNILKCLTVGAIVAMINLSVWFESLHHGVPRKSQTFF